MLALRLITRSPELVSFLAGVSLHQSLLRHGEWNLYGPAFLATAIGSWWMLFFALILTRHATGAAFVAALRIEWSGIAGIFLSMSAYRLFFHRLRAFPGPLGSKVTSWWASTLHGPQWHFYESMQGLHEQYGDYVRVGMHHVTCATARSTLTSSTAPDALSIVDPAAVNAIHGQESRCTKGSFYSIAEPQRNLLMMRNHKEHARKRRDWDRAFNVKSLNDYDPMVWNYTSQLVNQVKANANKPMNIARWLQFFAFDIMTGTLIRSCVLNLRLTTQTLPSAAPSTHSRRVSHRGSWKRPKPPSSYSASSTMCRGSHTS